jgi:2-polyprenyl-3-methyl-5-hydroxy-6-metoxy-1,4-benzoquinol methylase
MSQPRQALLGGDTPLDPTHDLNARVEIASFLNEPPGVVLDVGCGGGAIGKLIKEKFPGTHVIGIEANAGAAEHARQLLDTVICASIDTVNLVDHVGSMRVNTVLLLDVLQHLVDPWHALRRIHGWLHSGTRVIASVPNIRNICTLDHLAAGRWDYDRNAVFDITHVRFFTKGTLQRLFEQTGYEVRNMEPLTQPALVERVVIQRGPGRIDTRNVRIKFRTTDALDELYAFQYVVDAVTLADAV